MEQGRETRLGFKKQQITDWTDVNIERCTQNHMQVRVRRKGTFFNSQRNMEHPWKGGMACSLTSTSDLL